MKRLITACFIVFAVAAFAQSKPEKKKFHFHKESEDNVGYTQAIMVNNTLYISGTVGVGKDAAEAMQMAFDGLKKVLASYGMDFSHVVKENLYTVNIAGIDKDAMEVRKRFYNGDYPAATWVQIERLLMEQALIEVEIIAVKK